MPLATGSSPREFDRPLEDGRVASPLDGMKVSEDGESTLGASASEEVSPGFHEENLGGTLAENRPE